MAPCALDLSLFFFKIKYFLMTFYDYVSWNIYIWLSAKLEKKVYYSILIYLIEIELRRFVQNMSHRFSTVYERGWRGM